MRKTKREIIYNTLKKNCSHPDVNTLFTDIHVLEPTMGIATVYRNLNKMVEEGKIKKVVGMHNSAHFDHNTYEHYHFLCTKCGKIYDIDKSVAEQIEHETEKLTGFKINECDITFKGICNNCLNKKEENK